MAKTPAKSVEQAGWMPRLLILSREFSVALETNP